MKKYCVPSVSVLLMTAFFAFFTEGRLYAQEIDWGDAPAPYPTLSSANGANHAVGGPLYLGANIDTEPDGQPDPNARGDDSNILYPGIPNPPGDEDGVIFTSGLLQGHTVSVTVIASASGGQLDAWVDFNQNGIWEPSELIFASVPLASGPNYLSFSIPGTTPVGQTYARFRISSGGGLPPDGAAPDGEVEDYELWIEQGEQPDPNKMHWAQYPDPDGWDVRACFSEIDGKQKVLADDFRCTSNGPINHITFWGSWFGDHFEEGDEFQAITNIHLSIHSDIPDPDGEGPEYSHPGTLLWKADFDPHAPPKGWVVKRPAEEDPSWQGWYDPNMNEVFTNNHKRYFRYEIDIPPEESFVQSNETIYWLDISITTADQAEWGWKTSRSPHFNDDAVWADLPVEDPQQWNELHDPIYSNSLDLAFIIDGGEDPQPENNDWGDLPDSFNTQAGNNGAYHIIAGSYLGTTVDAEPDGQASPAANGDDNNGVPPDEDGVTFVSPAIPGQNLQLSVVASGSSQLDIWMDLNASGIWDLPAEHVYSGNVLSGANAISIPIPFGTPAGQTYLRFRLTSNSSAYVGGAPLPTGKAFDGEVEDYIYHVEKLDWGDAPDPTYPTLSAFAGAHHLIAGGTTTALRLGKFIDNEPDGQPTSSADGDDKAGIADEDGVTFDTPLIPGTVAQITVSAGQPATSASAYLQAWCDFNCDGDWTDPGEQIFANQSLTYSGVATPTTLTFPVPASATPGTTALRFRLSTVQNLPQTGFARNGEVEDYLQVIEAPAPIDWGDAPDSLQTPNYPTYMANNGAHHVMVSGMYLGASVDPEPDGQPTAAADGDDLANSDDEDGVTFLSLIQPGSCVQIRVIASTNGTLDAWMDFGRDGSWAQPIDRIITGKPLHAGTNLVFFTIPVAATNIANQLTFSRFRFTRTGISVCYGLATEGEVEDYEVGIMDIEEGGMDFGDAPLPYRTLLPNGAQHIIVAGYALGSLIDGEPDGQPDPIAMRDDVTNLADEDGVSFFGRLVAGSNATVMVLAGTLGGVLDAWLDLGSDGSFDGVDKIFSHVSLSPGPNILTFLVPTPPSTLGPTFARFRLTSAGIPAPDGPASDGEVEDYLVEIYQPAPTNLTITNIVIQSSNTQAKIEWNAESNLVYELSANTNLMVSNGWAEVGGWVIGPNNWQTNDITAETNKFYRVTAPWTTP